MPALNIGTCHCPCAAPPPVPPLPLKFQMEGVSGKAKLASIEKQRFSVPPPVPPLPLSFRAIPPPRLPTLSPTQLPTTRLAIGAPAAPLLTIESKEALPSSESVSLQDQIRLGRVKLKPASTQQSITVNPLAPLQATLASGILARRAAIADDDDEDWKTGGLYNYNHDHDHDHDHTRDHYYYARVPVCRRSGGAFLQVPPMLPLALRQKIAYVNRALVKPPKAGPKRTQDRPSKLGRMAGGRKRSTKRKY